MSGSSVYSTSDTAHHEVIFFRLQLYISFSRKVFQSLKSNKSQWEIVVVLCNYKKRYFFSLLDATLTLRQP